jgi:hypothetical protein
MIRLSHEAILNPKSSHRPIDEIRTNMLGQIYTRSTVRAEISRGIVSETLTEANPIFPRCRSRTRLSVPFHMTRYFIMCRHGIGKSILDKQNSGGSKVSPRFRSMMRSQYNSMVV